MNDKKLIDFKKLAADNFDHIDDLFNKLGVSLESQLKRNLTFFDEQQNLVDADVDFYNRQARLHPDAAVSWLEMKKAARQDRINLFICSAYRSYDYQFNLITNKVKNGRLIDEIITVLAPPGFSEHHTGYAVDIISDEIPELEQIFETTEAFAWLQKYAVDFNFSMSYPRDNPYGIIYEPWHWCYKT